MSVARELGMDCFSTPFDVSAVDFLEKCEVERYKIASFEVVDIPLLKKVASTRKPIIMSTGMATLGEINETVRTLREGGTTDLVLLKCTNAYPALPEEVNLLTIPHLAQAFNCRTGLSDHTMGSAVPVAAVVLGACVIKKHFTLSRADGGPDSSFSMEPQEFKQMVEDVRTAEKALGCVCYDLTDKQRENKIFRRSIFVVKDMEAGEVFTEDNLRCIRPGFGLHTRHMQDIQGKTARFAIKAGTPLSWEFF